MDLFFHNDYFQRNGSERRQLASRFNWPQSDGRTSAGRLFHLFPIEKAYSSGGEAPDEWFGSKKKIIGKLLESQSK